MNDEELDEQCEQLFIAVASILEDAPTMMVVEIAVNILWHCLLSLDKEGQKQVAAGVLNMFSDVNEISMGRKKIEH